MKERYHITGMTCSACSAHVEKAINKLEPVEKASVNLLTETMEVEYDETRLGCEEIERTVEKAGYGASLIIGGAPDGRTVPGAAEYSRRGNSREQSREELQKNNREEEKAMRWRLGISVGFLIPLMYLLPLKFGLDGLWASFPLSDFAAFLATLVFIWLKILPHSPKKSHCKPDNPFPKKCKTTTQSTA